MAAPLNSPLDFEEKEEEVLVEEKKAKTINFILELIPLSIIGLGVFCQNKGYPISDSLLMYGGGISAFIYIFFSWYMFKVKQYQFMEVGMSILTGLVFGFGIFGLILKYTPVPSADFLGIALKIGLGMMLLSGVLLVVHIRDERGSAFYRNLLARLLAFTTIMLTLYVN